jgi:hypothetical protein
VVSQSEATVAFFARRPSASVPASRLPKYASGDVASEDADHPRGGREANEHESLASGEVIIVPVRCGVARECESNRQTCDNGPTVAPGCRGADSQSSEKDAAENERETHNVTVARRHPPATFPAPPNPSSFRKC